MERRRRRRPRRPTGLGLRLFREGVLSGVTRFVGMQDITLGDPRFDERFVVQGKPEAAVRELLTEPVRDALVAIQDQAASFEAVMTEPAAIDGALAHLGFVATELGRLGPSAGPYRV